MRIQRLRLKNFAPIYYALDKEEINLDYSREDLANKTIFIFVGKMGSCKTFLLGHHQPFATLGTLDARNNEDLVLPGKRGVKEIVYTQGPDVFEIMHVYMPNGENSHSVKSYFKKNGVELNQNGNANSFKVIVEVEFGLEQNYLKLFRIGANVVNLPDMGSSERKTFISSMLTETDVFTFLFKRLGERARTTNAQMSMLLNRLRSISNRSDEELEKELQLETEMLKEVADQYANLQKEQYRIEAEMRAICPEGHSYDDKASEKAMLDRQLASMTTELESAEKDLAELATLPSAIELTEQVAALRSRCQMRDERIIRISSQLDGLTKNLNGVRDKLATMRSAEQIAILRETYDKLMHIRDEYAEKLKNFIYEGSAATIESLVRDSQLMNELIARAAQYSPEILRQFFSNPGKAIAVAQRETSRLEKEKAHIQQEMENLSAASTYVATHIMVRPPMCPTEDCPYFKHHPYTESRRRTGTQLNAKFLEHRNTIQAINAKILRYQDYPTIASQISNLKNSWKRVMPQMDELGLLIEDDLEEIVINPTKRNWFNHKRADQIRELCGIREKSYEITQRMANMQNELALYEISDRDALEKEKARLETQTRELSDTLQKLESDNRTDRADERRLSDQLGRVMMLQSIQDTAEKLQRSIEDATKQITTLEKQIRALSAHAHNLSVIKSQISSKQEEYQVHESSCGVLRRKIADIKYCKVQYEEANEEYEVLKDILEATSSKNGIPLAFVKLFLSDCKGIINELISDVFQDHIELQDFYIPENSAEFFIPYTCNGALIQDVNKASQGERAIISMALSFALIRQAMFQYNVMLLDEMDSPLYREDRNKFIAILLKQVQAMHAEQVFLISHNNTFDGFNVAIIMTTDEQVDETPLTAVIHV